MFAPRKALWCARRRKPLPPWGLTRRLLRGGRACNPHGVLIYFGGDPKGCRGRAESHPACINKRQLCRKPFPLAGPDAPTPAQEQGLQPYGALSYFRRRSEGVQGASGKPPACIMGNNFVARNSPLAGLDAPTPARIGTGRPMGRSHFSFGGERKVCNRKPAARQLLRPAPLRVAGFGQR